jgi:glycosyltransferase involved in cell wall biosynthesis
VRCVFVTTSYPAYDGDPAGHFVASEARAAAAHAEITVIAPAPGTHATTKVEGDVTVMRLPHGEALGWPGAATRLRAAPQRCIGLAGYLWAARRTVEALAPDAVVAHWALPCGWAVASVSPRNLTIVSHGADVRLLSALPRAVRSALVSRLAVRCSSWRFVSDALYRELALTPAAAEVLAAKVVIQPSPIDLPMLDGSPVSPVSPGRDEMRGVPLFVSVGRLVASKNVHNALEYVATAHGRDARIVIVGDGPERPALERRAAELGVDARFLGLLSRPDALRWISASDAVLMASGAEGLSTVVREAESLGVPVRWV